MERGFADAEMHRTRQPPIPRAPPRPLRPGVGAAAPYASIATDCHIELESPSMPRHRAPATNLVVRLPSPLHARLDHLAAGVNRTKSEVVRYWLAQLDEAALPSGWREDARRLKAARVAR